MFPFPLNNSPKSPTFQGLELLGKEVLEKSWNEKKSQFGGRQKGMYSFPCPIRPTAKHFLFYVMCTTYL